MKRIYKTVKGLFRDKIFLVVSILALSACSKSKETTTENVAKVQSFPKGSFGYDLNFLKQYHKDVVVLGDDSLGGQIVVLPAYQGRVMTSTFTGYSGGSLGWINYDLIASGIAANHINAFGGEERLWLGPEGGQFSIYFKKGVEFTFDNWFVPKELDTEAFTLVSSTNSEATFQKEMHLENYSGNNFDLQVNRTIRLLNKTTVDSVLGITIPERVHTVAFESDNSITNTGKTAWNKKSGMLSIWILSMLNATEKTTVAIPYKQGDNDKPGKIVTDDYFGKVSSDRLKVSNGLILFKADANNRSKIGVTPSRALPIVASYDALNNILTIAQFTLPQAKTEGYVNSLWKIQDNPFDGDAINAYNDGPNNGSQLGRFYEIESSSPAAALMPGTSLQHLHRTIHLQGDKESLNAICEKLLGVSIDQIITL
jgi:hypothetical protein